MSGNEIFTLVVTLILAIALCWGAWSSYQIARQGTCDK